MADAKNVRQNEKPHEYLRTSDISGPDIPYLTTESEADDDLIGRFARAQDWESSVRAKKDTRSPTVDVMRYPKYPGTQVA
jgi:hypothetical protein